MLKSYYGQITFQREEALYIFKRQMASDITFCLFCAAKQPLSNMLIILNASQGLI